MYGFVSTTVIQFKVQVMAIMLMKETNASSVISKTILQLENMNIFQQVLLHTGLRPHHNVKSQRSL